MSYDPYQNPRTNPGDVTDVVQMPTGYYQTAADTEPYTPRRRSRPTYDPAPQVQQVVHVHVHTPRTPTRSVTKVRRKSKASHQLALIICTGGLWLVAEPVIWLFHQFGPRKTRSVTYHEYE